MNLNERIAYLIIASSGRALVNSAKKAGYKVDVIDAFLDQETVLLSSLAFKVTYTHQFGFDSNSIKHKKIPHEFRNSLQTSG